jgi:hypothetical protein
VTSHSVTLPNHKTIKQWHSGQVLTSPSSIDAASKDTKTLYMPIHNDNFTKNASFMAQWISFLETPQ